MIFSSLSLKTGLTFCASGLSWMAVSAVLSGAGPAAAGSAVPTPVKASAPISTAWTKCRFTVLSSEMTNLVRLTFATPKVPRYWTLVP